MKTKLIIALAAALSTSTVHAEVEETLPKDPFTAQTKLGFIYTENTSSSLSYNTALNLKYSENQWEHKGGFESYYTDADNDDDGANRYTINAGSTYDYTKASFLKAATRFENDLYGTYRKQWVLMSGLGFYLHNTETAKLSVSLGPGYRISERQPNDSEFPSLRNYEVIATSNIDGSVSFSETFSVGAAVDVAHGEENTHYNTKAYMKNILMGSLALVFDVEYIYNTTVADDQSNDEIYSTMSLSYDF
ncbi:DUF481 domain-containing protein [Vibrio sp. Isolate23]|uniref:DUF481 domain-containing protein n=1 Tax=Vibrio sp. Isolate23 TaxID=2908533 RepID=UPI001EFD6F8A|nr:DUF481 domain-containing protein [Vibrio sp. Isolate23]MCG9683051.1 DUF481 domain-containing protein [Vibrio sp. Isolate23]